MEVALARLVGAGLTLVFEGFEEAVPEGAVENGLQLIRHIARERPDVVATLTQGVVKDIWREWRQAKLPRDVALVHIEALPYLMDRCRSSDGMMLGAVAAIQVARRIGAAARPVSHSSRVATAIIGRALETGLLNARGLNESIAFFFLDRLLARLMPDQQLFLDLRPVFLDYLDQKAWKVAEQPVRETEPSTEAESAAITALDISNAAAELAVGHEDSAAASSHSAVTANAGASHADSSPTVASAPVARETAVAASPPAERIASQYTVPASVLSHLADRAAGRLGILEAATLEDLALGLRDILARLKSPTDADPVAAGLQREAAAHIEACDLAAADRVLGQAEDVHLKAAPLDLATAQARLAAAAATRSCRAQLEEIGGDFRRAARHYAAAARCLADGDRKGRRGYLMRQAGALVAQGELGGETAALAEAAQVYADAGRLLSEQDAPLEWATTHLDLGRILMELGEREQRPERFLAAALHFKPASDVFSRLKEADNWARAQLGLADALRCQGEVQGDVVTLSEAAFAYRASLGIATRDRMPAEWGTACYRLAVTLLRIDSETGEITQHEEAAMALRAVLGGSDAVSDVVRCSAKAALAKALVGLAVARDEHWHGDEAVTMLHDARADGERCLKSSARAGLDDEVATLLGRIGEASANPNLIAEAGELKLAALDYYQAAGQTDVAERIRGELGDLDRSVARLVGRVAEGAAA